jgi:predicted nucleotidyltransferase
MTRLEIIQSLRQYKRTAEKYSIARLGLFGSFARGQNNKHSDINILIDFSTNDIGWEYFDIVKEIKELFIGTKVDVVSRRAIPDLYWNEIKNEVVYA